MLFYSKGCEMMHKYMKYGVICCALIGVGFVLFAPQDGKDEYITQKLTKGNIIEKVTASGIINPISTINIGTQVSGTISEIYVDYNSKVSKNQILTTLT